MWFPPARQSNIAEPTDKFWHYNMTRTSNLKPLDLLVPLQKALFSSTWDIYFLRTERILYNLKWRLCIFQRCTIAYTDLRLEAELTRVNIIGKNRLHETHTYKLTSLPQSITIHLEKAIIIILTKSHKASCTNHLSQEAIWMLWGKQIICVGRNWFVILLGFNWQILY